MRQHLQFLCATCALLSMLAASYCLGAKRPLPSIVFSVAAILNLCALLVNL